MLNKMLLDKTKEWCKFPYYMEPIGFCLHNTDNSAPAINERNNLNRAENTSEVSFHVVTDEKESIQCIEFNRNAWASGDGKGGEGNRKYIHWEIARSHHADPSLFAAAQERAAKDMAEELKKRGWGIDRIRTHRDFSGKNCPSRTDINKFKQKVQAYLNNSSINIPSTNPEVNTGIHVGDKVKAIGRTYATGQEIPSWVKDKAYEVIKISGNKVLLGDIISWVYSGEVVKVESKAVETPEKNTFSNYTVKITTDELNVRRGPSTGYKADTIVRKGEVYTIVEESNGWGKLKSGAGWISLAYTSKNGNAVSEPQKVLNVGSKIKITGSNYATGQVIPGWVKTNTYTVQQIKDDKVLVKELVSWVFKNDIKLV